jgi:hypothetical protein
VSVYSTVLAAYQLGLFRELNGKPSTPREVAKSLGIEERPAETLLVASASLGLLSVKCGRYALSATGEDYLSERSTTFFGPFLDLMIASQPLCSAEVIKKAVTTNSPQAPATSEMYRSPEQAAAFYKAMHAHSIAEAIEWPTHVDLSQHQILLDVGGGSGVHTRKPTRTYTRSSFRTGHATSVSSWRERVSQPSNRRTTLSSTRCSSMTTGAGPRQPRGSTS